MFCPTTILRCSKPLATEAAKANATAKLQTFRQIVQSRVSARRFEPNVAVPDDVWRDVLQMTLVRIFSFYLMCFESSFHFQHHASLHQ